MLIEAFGNMLSEPLTTIGTCMVMFPAVRFPLTNHTLPRHTAVGAGSGVFAQLTGMEVAEGVLACVVGGEIARVVGCGVGKPDVGDGGGAGVVARGEVD